jgi:hypothetical protein
MRIYPLVLINLMTPAKLTPDLGSWGHLRRETTILTSCLRHIFPLKTTSYILLDIYKVFEPLVCFLKGIWVHRNIITPAKLVPDLGILGGLWSESNTIMPRLRLIPTSDLFIHPC